MTHSELCDRAVTWLYRTKRCDIVISQCGWCRESPDALGWKGYEGTSYLIECKVSLEDFYRDKRKWFRRHPEEGMGRFRWFLTPKGLVTVEQLPERWGLLEIEGRRIKELRAPESFQHDRKSEVGLLVRSVIANGYGKRRVADVAVFNGMDGAGI